MHLEPDVPLFFLLLGKPEDLDRRKQFDYFACEHEMKLVTSLCLSPSFGCYDDVVPLLRGGLEVDLVEMVFDRVKTGLECELFPLDVFVFYTD